MFKVDPMNLGRKSYLFITKWRGSQRVIESKIGFSILSLYVFLNIPKSGLRLASCLGFEFCWFDDGLNIKRDRIISLLEMEKKINGLTHIDAQGYSQQSLSIPKHKSRCIFLDSLHIFLVATPAIGK